MGLYWSRTPPCIATMGPCDITLPPAVMSSAVTMALPRLGVGQMAGDWAMSVGWDTCNRELGTGWELKGRTGSGPHKEGSHPSVGQSQYCRRGV